MPGGEWAWHPMWGPWDFAIVLAMLFFWTLVLVGVALGIRWLVRQALARRPDAALAILRERYARGEIGKGEFDAKRRDLEA